MGVYIKGLGMPKSCDDCFLPLQYCPYAMKPDGSCPLVPVPPHGDLIDRDALKAKQQENADLFKRSASYGDRCRRDEAMKAVANIVNAPTIIPAEEGET